MTVVEWEHEFALADAEYQSEVCATFQRLLETDLRLLERIRAQENAWRANVRTGTVRFDADIDRRILQWYRCWVENAEVRLQQLELQESKGCHLEAVNRFRESL